MKKLLFCATIALAFATGATAADRSATSGDASLAKNSQLPHYRFLYAIHDILHILITHVWPGGQTHTPLEYLLAHAVDKCHGDRSMTSQFLYQSTSNTRQSFQLSV